MRAHPVGVPSTVIVECTTPGCGWRAEIPVLYRLEPCRNPSRLLGGGFVTTRIVVDDDAVTAFDTYVAGHLAQHDIAETLLARHPDDPGPAEP